MGVPVDGPDIASEFIVAFKVRANCFRQVYGVRISRMDEADEW
jgi:hypothetical protein